MPSSSSLTRGVFRALLADRPYAFAECNRHSRVRSVVRQSPAKRHFPHAPHTQRRTIFGIGMGATPRALADAKNTANNLDIALGRLVDLIRARRTLSKPPPKEEVADALRFIFRSHLEKPRHFSHNEIYIASEAFKYVQEQALEQEGDADMPPALSKDDLTSALQALAISGGKGKFRSDIGALAYCLFEQLQKPGNIPEDMPAEVVEAAQSVDISTIATYIQVLSSTGRAKEARDLLRNSSHTQQRSYMPMWIAVVRGLFDEGLEKDALETLAKVQETVGNLSPVDQEQLIDFLAQKGNLHSAKKVYDLELESQTATSLSSTLALINLCTRNQDFEWSKRLVSYALGDIKDPEVLNALILWYVTKEMKANGPEQSLRIAIHELGLHESSLIISNFNWLIENAYSCRNPEAGTKFLEMAQNQGQRPDGKTFLAKLAYDLDIGDLGAAKSTYEAMLAEDMPSDGSDIPVINRFLGAICFSQKPEMDLIMRTVDGLLDRGAELDAETVAGLCHVYLHRDETEDAIGLLKHRVDYFPHEDRARVSSVFETFILNVDIETHRAFNAYELFRHAFPETPIEKRLIIMNAFFDRNRSDLACLVFGHMRQRDDLDARPTAEAYAQCYEGIARCRDVDGLQMVYNMLKMDREVAPTTRIHNALMAAYTACQMPFTAIIDHFWKIMDSREGPTLSSFALALRACETWVPQGSQEARRIMALMQRWGFEINREIYHCYIGALAGQCEFERTVELIEEMENDVGERPDVITIGTFYNAIPWQYRKDEVESWAKQAYPDLWEQLVAHGDEIDEEWEVRYFKIDRSINIDDEPIFDTGEYDPQIAREPQMNLEAPLK